MNRVAHVFLSALLFCKRAMVAPAPQGRGECASA